MIAAGLAGLVLGCLLGLRFRVFVLVPVEIGALLIGAAVAMGGITTGAAALEGFVLFSTGVQITYMLAVTLPVAARRAPSRPARA